MTAWERNAEIAEKYYGSAVDYEERWYICPECGDPIYESDYSQEELLNELCPVCGYNGDFAKI